MPHALAADAAPVASYQLPDASLQAIVDAPATPTTVISPQKHTIALLQRPGLPSIETVAQPELRLAGIRLNGKMRSASRFSFANSVTLTNVATGEARKVSGFPANPRIADAKFSPDERWMAVSLWQDDGIKLWLVDVKAAKARMLIKQPLNATLGQGFEWAHGSSSLLVQLVPAKQAAQPVRPTTPTAPIMNETVGGPAAQNRTYPDLLKTPYDSDLLDWALTNQIATVTLDGKVGLIGQPDRIMGVDASPDGRYLLVSRLHRPYSTLVPLDKFPESTEVWDARGKLVKTIHDRALQERMPQGNDAVQTGPRYVSWRADAPATLLWAEALDGGDPSAKVEERDGLYLLAAPFTGKPTSWMKLKARFAGVQWGRDDLALVSEYWWKTRDTRTWMAQPGKTEAAATLLFSRKSEDRYNDPGRPLMKMLPSGERVLQTSADGKSLFLTGTGASPEGDRPFLDRLSLADKQTTRLWRSEAPHYEFVMAVLDDAGERVLTQREAVDEFPNLYVREGKAEPRALTHTPHPLPQLKSVQMQQLRYKRADGVELTAKLYLPPNYDAKRDGPLPLLMWAYPNEFKSAAAASQVKDSPYRFKRISPSSPLAMLARGYAVLDDPTMPIVGEGDKEPNDTYLPQLVASAQAAVDEVVRLGVADRDHIAVGGHSYGAFMTANLLAHTRLFKAGIARSGAYNRTLTPFGFQSEERNFWQAKDVYQTMSPFNHANQIKDAILMIHGQDDSNPGTFPIQSERLYQALQGLGATARFVYLPNEDHGYRARESVLHMLWEQDRWLNRYIGVGKVSSKP
ncbi:prolyl oligopeptidase family serine peptidase [Burkholderiaceae bacterium DAT-1]|nr:prolyl oligopeptidase family serine peptidase [Burkholderiaceae bacterium DAT-1]